MLFRLFRSRLVWLTIGVLTVAGTAFLIVVVAVAFVMYAAAGGTDPEPDELGRIAGPLGLLASVTAVAGCIAVIVAIQRGRTRHWLPLREQMVYDAATLPDTHLAQIASTANPAAGGQVVATDLITGDHRPLWLPSWNPPRGAVVCFTATPNGGQVRAWMTGKLWRATSREGARIERRTTTAHAAADREQHEAEEQRIRDAADEAVAQAERILRQHGGG
jgi:hypothetical protein